MSTFWKDERTIGVISFLVIATGGYFLLNYIDKKKIVAAK